VNLTADEMVSLKAMGGIINLWKKGLPEKQIFNQLKLKEVYFAKYFCFGNVSMQNGGRSVIRH